MKLKNKDIRAIYPALISLGNHQTDIKKRWEISKIAKKFSEANELLEKEINKIVEEKGVADDSGQKKLSTDNADYQKLLNLTNEVDCKYLTFENLEEFNATVQEMINLEVLIKEGD